MGHSNKHSVTSPLFKVLKSCMDSEYGTGKQNCPWKFRAPLSIKIVFPWLMETHSNLPQSASLSVVRTPQIPIKGWLFDKPMLIQRKWHLSFLGSELGFWIKHLQVETGRHWLWEQWLLGLAFISTQGGWKWFCCF